ncbi:hypothetical protein D3C76_1063090 [compost metagenome]|jgi:hypothetical protein
MLYAYIEVVEVGFSVGSACMVLTFPDFFIRHDVVVGVGSYAGGEFGGVLGEMVGEQIYEAVK